jgi:hypothetical protein
MTANSAPVSNETRAVGRTRAIEEEGRESGLIPSRTHHETGPAPPDKAMTAESQSIPERA